LLKKKEGAEGPDGAILSLRCTLLADSSSVNGMESSGFIVISESSETHGREIRRAILSSPPVKNITKGISGTNLMEITFIERYSTWSVTDTLSHVYLKEFTSEGLIELSKKWFSDFPMNEYGVLNASALIVTSNLDKAYETLLHTHGDSVKRYKLKEGTVLVVLLRLNTGKIAESDRDDIKIAPINSSVIFTPIVVFESVDNHISLKGKNPLREKSILITKLVSLFLETIIISLTVEEVQRVCDELLVNLPIGTEQSPKERLDLYLSMHEKLTIYHHVQVLAERWIHSIESSFERFLDGKDKELTKFLDMLHLSEAHPESIRAHASTLKESLEKTEGIIQFRTELAKAALVESRIEIEKKQERRLNIITTILGILVIFEIITNFLSWFFKDITLLALAIWIGIIIGVVALALAALYYILRETQ